MPINQSINQDTFL